MEFNYLVEKRRMLDSLGCIRQTSGTCDGLECNKCPLSKYKNGYDLSCSTFEIKYPLEATEIVRKWAEEHPRKTRKNILFEKFPGAKLKENGGPYACCWQLGMATKEECNGITCMDCWNTEVEE